MALAAVRHQRALIAGLVLIGALWATSNVTFDLFGFADHAWPITCGLGGFIAASVSRRVLGLDIGDTVVAAIVTAAVVVGIYTSETGDALEVSDAVPIVAAAAGSLAAAMIVRPAPTPSNLWLVIAAGLGSFGTGILASAIAGLITGEAEPMWAACVGAVAGGCLLALRLEVDGWHCAVGMIVVVGAGVMPKVFRGDTVLVVAPFMFALVPAIGGAIGSRIRTAQPEPRPDIPPAHVR